jgi:hypothetical protein
METRLLQALEETVVLGDGRTVDSLSEWMVLLGDIPDSTILCDLPVLLGRLARDDQRTGDLAAAGLLPETGSRPLFFQALAARVSSRVRAQADAAREAGLPVGASAVPARVMREAREAQEIRHQMNNLADAALAVEAERERLERERTALTETLKSLESDVARGIKTFARNRQASPRALADLAESMGLLEEARLLRALPSLPFTPHIPNRPPRGADNDTHRMSLGVVADRDGDHRPVVRH